MTSLPRPLRFAAVAATAGLLATGCSFHGLYGVQLPGGVSGPMKVTAVFDNVMELVPQSAVKVDDVTVGTVTDISLTPDYKARVTMAIKNNVQLPANAVAVLQKTSLLGEKFVELEPPPNQTPQGTLASGMVIPLARTQTYPDVEEVFGVLASVLNGGGLEKLQTISFELSRALAGRESSVRDVLRQLNVLLGGLDQQKQEIVRALDQMDALTGRLNAQRQTIATALDDLGPGLKVLADNRAQLTNMLSALSRLGQVGTRVINASRDNTVASLRLLQPVLGQLRNAGQNLPKSLDLLLDYPFPRNSVDGIPGDFTNLSLTLDICSAQNALPAQLSDLSKVLEQGLGCTSTGSSSTSTSKASQSKAQAKKGAGSGTRLPVPVPSLPSVPVPTTPSLPGVGGLLQGATQ